MEQVSDDEVFELLRRPTSVQTIIRREKVISKKSPYGAGEKSTTMTKMMEYLFIVLAQIAVLIGEKKIAIAFTRIFA